jgi:hypothetical protein
LTIVSAAGAVDVTNNLFIRKGVEFMNDDIKKYLEENLKINVINYVKDAGLGVGAKIQLILDDKVIDEDFIDLEQ